MITLAQGVAMIPLTEKLRAELKQSNRRPGKPAFSGFENLSAAVASWISNASADTTLAWIEATYFGGWGGQTLVVWQNKEIVIGPASDSNAINRALKLLGVQATENLDEFDTLKLGRYKHTKQWLELHNARR
jgi:type IV secretory pathway VirB6-like protein